MKRILILFLAILLSSGATFAAGCRVNSNQYDFDTEYKCSQLIQKIRAQKNTLYNVLGLSAEQRALKDEIEQRRKEEMKPYDDSFQCERKLCIKSSKNMTKNFIKSYVQPRKQNTKKS